ncbi:MAG TPA: hypothetical protein VMW50_13050 [Dehalococcoidia bacterium]|nr:hypothetical protein [Dehalococcoidia bacterium]
MMRAILIDPFTQTIEEVDYSGDYKDIYGLIECDLFTTVYLPNTSDDTLFVDDEGLYVENQRFFKIEGYEQPLAGRGLLLGTDEEGESIDCMSTVEEVKAIVSWEKDGTQVEASFMVMAFNQMKDVMDADELTDKELLDLLIGEERVLH